MQKLSPLEALDGDLLDVPHGGGWAQVSRALCVRIWEGPLQL
jgi:hypothetical protein